MKFQRLTFTILLLSFISLPASAQFFEYDLEANAYGNYYSGEESPFWFHSNKRGRIDETANFSTWLNGSARTYFNNESFLEVGAGILFQDGYIDRLRFDESYLKYQNSWFSITAGREHRQEKYSGLSASNENILWSLNARPLPGIQIETNKPIFFSNDHGLGFTASYGEYFLDDDRFVRNTRVHHKSLNIVYKTAGNFQLSAGLQHFVQWGGTSPEYGELSSGLDGYIRVITGQQGDSENGVLENAEGNQLGSYEVKLSTEINKYKVELLYNNLFEDGSGRMLYNTPDGRYGIYIEDTYKLEQNSWIKAVMYELYYTRDQSEGSGTTDGDDNYFVHNMYKSGWTYENKVIGVPFITMNEDRTRVYNNTIVAHHLAFTGMAFGGLPYKFLGSYRSNYGNKGNDILDNTIFSTLLDAEVFNRNNFIIDVQLGADFISDASSRVGAGIKISKVIY
ncbi:capsule assembly Wzi family protein [Autumnicola musiva]|uniref:Capsule assembly Wzi family protein n=1 Tax=Autumnicola musiva TaxID=3075589 RepID=A0ABU3D7H8_9FLAO|nr:capsule assembly Wzi family protein [Zunongwangia sp. F117]MDT0677485.1 capsule assembly Wzi family protein [Zunongwangia sp. F117]